MSQAGLTFPLIPRRRVAGLPYGALPSSRRGPGLDLVGSRPYRPGDDFRLIDWRASARRSSERASDELIVREHLTEEATRVVIAVDRSPTMALFPDELPWLSKPTAVVEAALLIAASARRARCPVEEAGGSSSASALDALARRERALPAGCFVFVLSDFLSAPSGPAWAEALSRRWDVVPVVVQDPTWEQSFPEVAGAVLPIADPRSGRLRLARMTRADVRERRRGNERRLDALVESFRRTGLDWVLLSSAEPVAVLEGFLTWAHGRERGRRLH